MTHKCGCITLAICTSLFFLSRADAQEQSNSPTIRRPSIGFRVDYFPDRLFQTGSASAHTDSPVADYAYTGSSSATKWAVGPTVEYRLKPRFSVGLEFRIHQVEYQQVDQIRTGKLALGATTDSRPVTTVTQTTTARYWELPVLVHYYRLEKSSWLASRAYVSGGVEYRHVAQVRTGTDFVNADGTTDYHEVPATPQHTNQAGFVFGIGLRFIDDFNIKVAPEVRFTHWMGSTFQGPGYKSAANQVEAGFGLSF